MFVVQYVISKTGQVLTRMASLFIWPYILVTIATCCDASPVVPVSDKAHLKHTHVLVVFASILEGSATYTHRSFIIFPCRDFQENLIWILKARIQRLFHFAKYSDIDGIQLEA